ncbi:hypothetical protein EVAR_16055_1 [Eumeta japonica]|uniref:Uncharacterized protein n=1 Tax=Eumeta variegata TaxID=151549 RepID=A0A4C1VXZ0_EUMVA|nr:hypothetical protein EVAR_16055_1 [Eumeta japonica]
MEVGLKRRLLDLSVPSPRSARLGHLGPRLARSSPIVTIYGCRSEGNVASRQDRPGACEKMLISPQPGTHVRDLTAAIRQRLTLPFSLPRFRDTFTGSRFQVLIRMSCSVAAALCVVLTDNSYEQFVIVVHACYRINSHGRATDDRGVPGHCIKMASRISIDNSSGQARRRPSNSPLHRTRIKLDAHGAEFITRRLTC